MHDVISYSGWIGYNNIGDEALYMANADIFKDYELSHEKFYSKSNVVLYGGGTVIPHPEGYHDNRLAIAIGVGVKDPLFRNQPIAPIDITHILARNGAERILRNRYIRHGLRRLAWKVDPMEINDNYIDERLFHSVRNINLLSVRGPKSKEILQRYGVDSQVIGDTALLLEPTSYNHQSTRRIAVTLRSTSSGLKWTEDRKYINNILSFCRSHSSEYEFIFIPFYPEDIDLHIRLANSIENSEFKDFCSNVDVQAIIDEFAHCDLVIGERLHANVLAACSYTPFISIEYQPKNSDFADSIQMSEYNIRLDDLTAKLLGKRSEKLLTATDIVSQLEEQVSRKRDHIRSFADSAIELIEHHSA